MAARNKVYVATADVVDPTPASPNASTRALGTAPHTDTEITTTTMGAATSVWRRLHDVAIQRPRRAWVRGVVRPLRRRYNTLPWTTRKTASVAVTFAGILYLTVSVPLRIGLWFDPWSPGRRAPWTPELTVLTALDVLADALGAYEFAQFYHTWQDAFSQLSRSVSFELGKKLAKKAHHLHHHADKAKISTRQRQPSLVRRNSQAQWTLATIAPTAASAAQTAALQRQKNLEIVLELVALAPIELVALGLGRYNLVHVLRVPKLVRLYRITECLEKISRIFSERRWVQRLSFTGISSLVRNVAIAAVCSHWVACGYLLLAHGSCGLDLGACDPAVESSWVVKDRLLGATDARKYGRALYWAARTMVLLGYDDVTPVSDAETIYGLCMQVLGALVSTSLLATFLFIFRHRNSRQAAFNTHVDNAREYMKSQNMPRDVRRQVMSYFTYAWTTHHSLDGEEVLRGMPKHLQSKVVYTLKASRIKQVCFLMKESVEVINHLALALVHRVYIPTDSIIEPKINAKMFFVLRGTVILSAFDGSRPKECQTGDFFADCCLLAPEKYEEKAVAKTFCELYVLEKAAFDEALTHFYPGREQQVRDRMAETLDKYATQLRKTKKLLGLRGGELETSSHPSHGSGPSGTGPGGGGGGGPNAGGSGGALGDWRLPGSLFRVRWDLVRLVATVFVAFEVPYYIVFISNHNAQENFLVRQDHGMRFVATMAVECFFVVDLVLRMRYFAYLDPIVMLTVVDPGMIFGAYKTSGFLTDFAAVVPVALVLEWLKGRAEDVGWVFRLLRLLRLRNAIDLLQDITDYYGVSSKVQLILTLLLGVTMTLHVVACLWFEMAWFPLSTAAATTLSTTLSRQDCLEMATRFQNCSWVRFDCYGHVGAAFPVEDPGSIYQTPFAYLRSVYWSVVALTGVGYGDIVAFSTSESYFAAAWIFVGGILNFGVVGAMSSTIANLMASEHHHVEKLNTLNSIMAHLGITESLRGEIRRFYHHQFRTRKKAYESQLLSHLPDQLCYRISSLLHSEATRRIALFDSASREFLEEVTGKFRHRTYQNGETFYIEGDICKEFLVIAHGKVNMFFQSRRVPVGALHDGDCYGVNEFLLRRPHPVTLIASSPITASVMTREHFDVLLRKFEDEMADIGEEAFEAWQEDLGRLRRIARNLECLKLKPHVLQTTSLFYQKDSATTGKRGDAGLGVGGGGLLGTGGGGLFDGDDGGSGGRPRGRDLEARREALQSTWNMILTLWNTYNAFAIVFRIAFHAHLELSEGAYRSLQILDLLGDAYFVLDIYLKLYYFDVEEVGLENLWTRAERNALYRKSPQLKWDLFASLPLYYMRHDGPLVTSLCRLPRLARCLQLWTYLDEVIIQVQQAFASRDVSSYLSPLKLLFFLLLGSHYAACIFFWISDHECAEHPTHCWINHDHIVHTYHHAVPALYVRSFYWALTTLTLVGSREIVPRAVLGTFWAAITCLGCTFIMSYIIGELSELILDMGKEEKEFKSHIDSFEHFAKEHALSGTLRERVGLFFRVQFEQTEGKDLDATVHDLSANLRLKLMHEIYGSAIATLPISRFLTYAQVNNLALRLRTELFIPGDDILVENTFGTRLCILRRGLAGVLWPDSVTTVAVLMAGCLFGEVAFFLPRQRRIATVKATVACEVLHITNHAWDELWSRGGDATDTHVQRYALHSILDWARGRMLCYQESALTVTKRANRHLMERKIVETLKNMMAAPVTKDKRNGGSGVGGVGGTLLHRLDRHHSVQDKGAALLERKAKYLLSRADKYMKEHRRMLHEAAVAGQSYKSANLDALSLRRASRSEYQQQLQQHQQQQQQHLQHGHGHGHGHGPKHKKPLKTMDLNFRQFFAVVNPVNKRVLELLTDADLRALEDECWTRYRYMAALQHTIAEMMEHLVPRHTHHHHHPQSQSQQSPSQQSHTSSPQRHHSRDGSRRHHRRSSLHVHPTAANGGNNVDGGSGGHRGSQQHPHADDIIQRLRQQRDVDDRREAQRRKSIVLAAQPHLVAIDGVTTGTTAAATRTQTSILSQQVVGRFVHSSVLGTKATKKDARGSGSDGNEGAHAERVARLRRMRRCHSLPQFDGRYFAQVREREEARRQDRPGALGGIQSSLLGDKGLNFDILQRCRRPKFSALYRFYRDFTRWRASHDHSDPPSDLSVHSFGQPPPTNTNGSPSSRGGNGGLVSYLRASISASTDSSQSRRPSVARWQRAARFAQSQKRLAAEGHPVKDEASAVAFQETIKRVGRAWDLLITAIVLYHAISAPFKVAFVHDLEHLPGLRAWSALEYVLDVLCLVDVGLRVRNAERREQNHGAHGHHHRHHRGGGGGGGGRHPHSRVVRALRAVREWWGRHLRLPELYAGIALDLAALAPLELLAFAETDVVWAALEYPQQWRRLCFLRLNKLLYAHRIGKLSEGLFQYAIYDLKLPVTEAALYFLRSFGAYLLMGHWIACIWFATSERAYQEYAYSWLSYAGMLVFVEDPRAASAHSNATMTTTSSSSHHRRFLSSSTTTGSSSGSSGGSHASSAPAVDLARVSLSRKYLRSMHFSIGSITTLFYGDVVSMNLLELFVEMGVILWSIYIYGSLVGAHGEILQAHSRKKAVFEQNLSELQHYLIQNDVPKALKKQIKLYYASIWRRRQGEDEFAAIAHVSRSLHEDVVYATLHRFAWKVSIFHAVDVHFLRALLVRLQYVVCSEDEEVVIRGDVDRSMYFIAHGRVLVKQDKSEWTKEKGDFFGELALLYGIARMETCIALTVSELYRLDHGPYEDLLLEFPEYRDRNKRDWTTAAPPPTVLSSLLQTFTIGTAIESLKHQQRGAAASGDVVPATTTAPPDGLSSLLILDEEVPHTFIFRSTMAMLSHLAVDALEAKDIIHRARQGARAYLKRHTGLETARVDMGGPTTAASAAAAASGTNVADETSEVRTFTPRGRSESPELVGPSLDGTTATSTTTTTTTTSDAHGDSASTTVTPARGRIQMLKREWTRGNLTA